MYYKTINNNKENWILFIHGLAGSHRTWKKQLDKFSKNYNLLLIDLEGHGKSIKSKMKINALEDNAKKIKMILDKENIEQVHIISLSLGTLIALEFTLKYPERVKSNILAGAIINLSKKDKLLLALAKKIKSFLSLSALVTLFAHIVMPRKSHKLSRDIFIKEAEQMKKSNLSKWMENIEVNKEKLKCYIHSINTQDIPTLFIMGKQDYLFLNGIKKLKNHIKTFHLKIINNCGHVCSIEKANVFNHIASDFLLAHKRNYITLPIQLKRQP